MLMWREYDDGRVGEFVEVERKHVCKRRGNLWRAVNGVWKVRLLVVLVYEEGASTMLKKEVLKWKLGEGEKRKARQLFAT